VFENAAMTNVRFVGSGTVLMSPRLPRLPARTLVLAGTARSCAGLPSGPWRATFRYGSIPQRRLAAFTSLLRTMIQTEADRRFRASMTPEKIA
jgi:hypothetical protein